MNSFHDLVYLKKIGRSKDHGVIQMKYLGMDS
jgi:hypothetical protein